MHQAKTEAKTEAKIVEILWITATDRFRSY